MSKPLSTISTPELTAPMFDLMYTVAQHKYGWTYVRRYGGGQQIADGLERRGLVTMDREKTYPTITATDAGRRYIERYWPVSPFALNTYEHQPNGWTPRAGVLA